DETEAQAFAVAENSQDGRTDLTYVELGRSFQSMTEKGWGVAKIASKAGVHSMTVRRALALMESPKEILDLVDKGTLSESAALVFAKLDSKVQNILLSADYADKLEKASAHYIKELAKQAQKQIDKASGTEGGSDKESEAGGKKKGKVKVNWRSPSDRNQVIRELAHIAFNKKNEGAEDARSRRLSR